MGRRIVAVFIMVMITVSVLTVVISMNAGAVVIPPSSTIEKVVFASDSSGNWDIWMMNLNGTELKQLTIDPANDIEPKISPDGKKVAFTSLRNGNPDICVLDLQTGMITQLTKDNPELDMQPTWSPDSAEIAFASRRGGYDAIWKISVSSGTATQVTFPTMTTPSERDISPDWNPDGNHIVFQSTEGHKDRWAIWEVSLTDGTEKQIIEFFGNEYNPVYSPDGTQIAWNHWLGSFSPYTNIWLADADGSNREQLTSGNFMDEAPDWSPNGTQIIFQSNRGGILSSWIINIYGFDLTWLKIGGSSKEANWDFVYIDTTNPPAPIIASSTHPNEDIWYNNNDPLFTWMTPSDPSGILGYSYTIDQSSSTTPDTSVDTTGNSKSYVDLADGTWYFHVRAKDNAGNWGSADHYRVNIENTNPPAPIIASSTHPNEDIWYKDNNDPLFTWMTPSDPSGILGYSYTIDHYSSTTPDTSVDTTRNSKSYANVEDGTWYFHVRAQDKVENWGSADHYRVNIDTTNPPAPIIASSTHPNEDIWYNNNDPLFTWMTPSDPSGILGYSYTIDHYSSKTPDTSVDTAGNSKSYTNVEDGTWYFYVRAQDKAGNIGRPGVYHFNVDTIKPSSNVNALSPTQTTTSFTISWNGSDTGGSDLKWYDIQYKDGPSGTWTDWKTQTTSTSATFGPNDPVTVQSGHTYYFQSRAQDNAGNWETYPGGEGDVNTAISAPPPTPALTPTPTIAPTPPPTPALTPTPTIAPTPRPTLAPAPMPLPRIPGFEVSFAVAGLSVVAYLLRRNA